MSARNWLFGIALGLTLACLGQAQEQAQPAEDRPEVQAQTSDGLPPDVSVRIIEDSEAAEARQRREEEARQREIEDLIAQQRMAAATEDMNEATQSMKQAAWLSVAVVAVGTALLVWTLFLTRQANQAARDTVRVTQNIGEAQVRAYPSVTSVSITGITNKLPALGITVKNSGNSPALTMKCRGQISLTYQEDIDPPGTRVQLGMVHDLVSLAQVAVPPNAEETIMVYAPHGAGDEMAEMMKTMASTAPRENPFWGVTVFFDWVDVFGGRYTFYIIAGQRPIGQDAVGSASAYSPRVLNNPLWISFQSESRKRNDG